VGPKKDDQDQLEHIANLNKNVEIIDTIHLQIKFKHTSKSVNTVISKESSAQKRLVLMVI